MNKTDLAALGELLIDFTPAGADTFTANPGGAPANVLAAAAKAGCSTAFLGKVGADAFGDRLERTLRENGVSTRALRRSDVHTTLAFVHLSPDGDRSFTFCRNHSADTLLSPEELDRELLRKEYESVYDKYLLVQEAVFDEALFKKECRDLYDQYLVTPEAGDPEFKVVYPRKTSSRKAETIF